MATPILEVVFNARNNRNDLLLKAKNPDTGELEPVPLDDVTRMQVRDQNGGTSVDIDSQTSPSAFNWLTTGQTGVVWLIFGDEGVAAGEYPCWLIVYDATNPEGIVWDQLNLNFKDS